MQTSYKSLFPVTASKRRDLTVRIISLISMTTYLPSNHKKQVTLQTSCQDLVIKEMRTGEIPKNSDTTQGRV